MNFKLRICWLYPELMSTYGDRGNIFVLQKRCLWRGIEAVIQNKPENADLIFGGGAQDRQQEIVMRELMSKKSVLEKLLNTNIPGLFVCGAPQLLGRPNLGLFDMETTFGFEKRLIGNLVTDKFVGFENHGGRTYLGKGVKPFAKVVKGFGNNGEDKTEGAVYKNWIATYSHGPLLPKNPEIADWLIKTALEVKYKKKIKLESLDDTLENQAHDFIIKNR
ncbi:cobalamin biosynthesis protein CobQ [Candidatus Microgenomates bacterium]|nr:cobalamin biosynthesis protein CobQ [Candidatus Microgenomates bacterium]